MDLSLLEWVSPILVGKRNDVGPAVCFEHIRIILTCDIILIELPLKTNIVLHDNEESRE